MKDRQNIGVTTPHNVISQKPTTNTITVDVYDRFGKKLIEGITPV